MNNRWWDAEYYAARSRRGGALTVIQQGEIDMAVMPVDPTAQLTLLGNLRDSARLREEQAKGRRR